MERERIERHPFVPPIYPTEYPQEIRPGEQTYLRFLEHRVESLLEDLVFSRSLDDLRERFDYYLKEAILLQQLPPDSLNPGDRMRLDTLEATINFVGDVVNVTFDSVNRAYQECREFIRKNDQD